jgi:hypothetical protein
LLLKELQEKEKSLGRLPISCVLCVEALIVLDKEQPDTGWEAVWKDGCFDCLEAPAESEEHAALQEPLSQFIANILLEQHGMSMTANFQHDSAQALVKPENSAGISRACDSCVTHWVLSRSMAVAADREKLANCRICLAQSLRPGHDNVEMTQILSYGLASRFLGSYVMSPLLRDTASSSGASFSALASSRSGKYVLEKLRATGQASGTAAASKRAGEECSCNSNVACRMRRSAFQCSVQRWC